MQKEWPTARKSTYLVAKTIVIFKDTVILYKNLAETPPVQTDGAHMNGVVLSVGGER